MTTLPQLLVFGAAAPLTRLLSRERARHWLMLAGSVLAVYWLQPLSSIRYLDFWLPTATLALTAWVWAVTRARGTAADLTPRPSSLIGKGVPLPAEHGEGRGAAGHEVAVAKQGSTAALGTKSRDDLITAAVVAGLVVVIGLMRYLGPACCVTAARPPALPLVLAALGLVGGVAALLWRLPAGRRAWLVAVVVLAALLVVLKAEPLTRGLSAGLRALAGQPAGLASAVDVRWLGFSYLAFRLMHVLRDRASGRLPNVSLREFLTYALFFPAFTAGPIDRVERFVKDYRQPFRLAASDVLAGGERVALGVLKKFVLADSLALIALNAANAAQTRSTPWLWVLVYAYAWRLYLDFGGYTDIALGLGRWFGLRLPENFDRPYTRQNLTLFWNSWHITLAQWFRAYVFNPLTRALRARPLPAWLIIFIGQFTIMVLIGLWHGVTWNFVGWGVWHAVGLFVHNRGAVFTTPRAARLDRRPRLKRAAHWLGVAVTFHFVALGWVWFALPTLDLSLSVLGRLFGVGA
jgi:D-alanyl-lipoteichoic acid acyltransferase DltB (MBOAT superfamily)